MFTRSVAFMGGLLLAASLAWADSPGSFGFPVPAEPNQVFFLQRSMNANTVVYVANMKDNGRISGKRPLDVYWRRYGNTGERQELNFAEQNLAYGVNAVLQSKEPQSFRITLKAYAKRSAVLRVVNNVPRLETKLSGRDVQLVSAYLHLDESKRVPTVTRVDAWGKALDTGEWVFESFIP
ncbi:MAG: DUF4833 domain-containing protein [Rhizobiales bacterium]|nr:DUF4833 domain-containing protein [Hyphomicrobiales bacterium]